MTWTETDLAYAAGILDGEGTINIRYTHRKSGTYHRLSVHVAVTNADLIQWFWEEWGGTRNIRRYDDPSHKTLYRWVAEGPTAAAFLEALRPYLKLKAQHADVALEFRKTIRRGAQRLTDDLVMQREAYRNRILHLNRRGGPN